MMEKNNSLPIQNCITADNAYFIILTSVLTLPFHILMIKVLIRDLRINLPRHVAMLCLTISDALQIFTFFWSVTTMYMLNVKKYSTVCDISRRIRFFVITMTVAVTSLSIIVLSVERYVACIHSFHLQQIFTKERMVRGISCIWIIGLICGTMAIVLEDKNRTVAKIVNVVFIFPTSIIISIAQCRLLVFSRKKLTRVIPGTALGCETEMPDFRRKEMKVAFIASIVAIAYIVGMIPGACLSLYELIHRRSSSTSLRLGLNKLMIINNFADPFIYGIGVVDARKAIVRNLIAVKNLITRFC